MRAIILAAGLGTRLKPLTDNAPKALLKIKDKTLLELQIKKIKASGINEIVINVHHFADKIIEFLEQNNFFDCSIEISDEREKLLDTGGGLKKRHISFLMVSHSWFRMSIYCQISILIH